MKDLNLRILKQQKIIGELRHKLGIIQDITNDSKLYEK